MQHLHHWFNTRGSSIRYWFVVFGFSAAIGILIWLSIAWSGFTEARNGLTLNLLSEIIGALLVAFLLDGIVRRAAEARQSELATLERQRQELAEYREIIERYIANYKGARDAASAVEQLEQLEATYDVFSARRHMEDVLAKNDPEGRKRIAKGLRNLIDKIENDDHEQT